MISLHVGGLGALLLALPLALSHHHAIASQPSATKLVHESQSDQTQASEPSQSGKPDRPNVVVILADDLGYGDVQAFNPKSKIPTPNLDRLAREGVRFGDAHSPSGVCTPTRYALLTGRYSWRGRLKRGVLFPPRDAPLIEKDRSTLGSLFKKHGYKTACIGKWHLGIGWARNDKGKVDFNAPFREGPTTRGFDEYFGIAASLDMVPYAYLQQDRPTAPVTERQPGIGFPRFVRKGPRATDFDPGECLDKLSERACAFVAREAKDKNRPFFLYFPLTAPHKPVWPAPRFQGRTKLGPYGDFIVQTDATVGALLDALDKAGVADDTLVVFTSDNGSFMYRIPEGKPGHADKETAHGFHAARHQSNHIWRGTKADVYEGGHRVPFLVRWPGRASAGQRCDATLCHVDLFATFADLLGHEIAADEGEDSYSFLPLLKHPGAAHSRPPVIHHSANGMFAIREGRHKLILGNGSGGRQRPRGKPFVKPYQLYDMQSDPSETKNLAAAHPELVERLSKLVATWLAQGWSVPHKRRRAAPKKTDGTRRGGKQQRQAAKSCPQTWPPMLRATSSAWNRFRGPNGQGVVDDHPLPVDFGPDKNCAWKVDVPLGHSSPVVWRDRVYVTGSEKDGSLYTLCIDRASGDVRWKRRVPRNRKEDYDKRNNAASATPCCDERGVVTFFPDFGMVAYDPDGREQWRHALGPYDNVYGMGASPVMHRGRVFLACDQQTNSYLLAVSRKDGQTLWRKERPFALSGHCTPIFFPHDAAANPQLILPGSFYLDAYDVRNGKRPWFVRGLCFEMKSTPVHDGTTLYINGYGSPLNQPGQQVNVPKWKKALADYDKDNDKLVDKAEMPRSRAKIFFGFVDLDKNDVLDEHEWGFLEAALASQNGMLAIKVGGKGDVTKSNTVWSYRRSVPQLPSPLLYRGVLYMLNDQSGLIVLLDPKSGEPFVRGRLEDARDNYYASPIAGDGKVYFVSQGGLVSVVRAGKKLETLKVHDLGEQCYATPAIDRGQILIRTTKTLYCFGKKS